MTFSDNLYDTAYACLMAQQPAAKCELTHAAAEAWRAGHLNRAVTAPPASITLPGYPATLQIVEGNAVPRRNAKSNKGQAALIHALAHIEFSAINLAWDAVYRFRDMPDAFYQDWIQVADEEALHFQLLHAQLTQHGCAYADLPVHAGLWEMAVKTAHDVLIRMALVPRVLEARGLDAAPAIIAKLQQQGQTALVEILNLILRDEVGHVAIGTRWFQTCCAERGLVPETTFQDLVEQYYQGQLKPPFNVTARLAAGFTEDEMQQLLARFGQVQTK